MGGLVPMKRFHRATALLPEKTSRRVSSQRSNPNPGSPRNAKPTLNLIMKPLQLLVVAGLALVSSFAARAEISAPAWLETYYLDPQPNELPRAIRELSNSGYFEQPGHS